MIAKDQNIALKKIAKEALKNPLWESFAKYCIDRERGLRKQAFKELDDFIILSKKWTFKSKVEFLEFLFTLFEAVKEAEYVAFPQPLSEKLIKPTLEEWCYTEKLDNRPFRWFGKYYKSQEHILKALEIDSKDDLSREAILSCWSYDIYFSLHHLPEGYIGDPQKDLKLIEKIKQHISLLVNIERKKYWTKEIEEDLELIKNYLEWKFTGHSNFKEWGEENHKSVGYGISRTYYYE